MTRATRSRWMALPLVLLLVIGGLAGCTTPGPTSSPTQTPESVPPGATPKPAAGSTPLKVGVSTNMPPLIYRQGQQITGLEAELAKGLANYLGRPLKFVEVAWQDQIPYLLDGKTDIIMSGLSITELRKMRIAFSDPYSRTGQMAIIRRGEMQRFQAGYYSVVEKPTVGAVENTTGAGFIRSRYGRANKQFFKTSADGIEALRSKSIDLLIHDAPVIMILAARHESELTPIYQLLTEEYLAWGLRRNDTDLLKAANRYVADLKRSGRLKTMVNRWLPISGK